jgi:hypothetical protein
MFCDGNGPCDPLEAWTSLNDYLNERRGVVVIQVAPQRLSPPRRGERARVDMNRRPVISTMRLMRGNTVIPPIETQRIYSVVNPTEYPENQRESLYSVVGVYDPNELVQPGNLEVHVFVQGGNNATRIQIPPTVVESVRRDLASVIR